MWGGTPPSACSPKGTGWSGVSVASDESAVIWNATDGRPLYVLRQHLEAMSDLEVSPCGEKLVTAGHSTVFLWDAATGRLEHQLSGHAGDRGGVAISKGGAKVVVRDVDRRRIFIYSGLTGELRNKIYTDTVVVAFALLASGNRLAAFTHNAATVWDTDTAEPLYVLDSDGFGQHLQGVVAAQVGEIVAACGGGPRRGEGARTAIWDGFTGRLLYRASGSGGGAGLCRLAVGPSGSVLNALAG